MADANLITRIPQQGDPAEVLLAKALWFPYTRSTYIPATGSITTQTTGVSIDTRGARALWASVNVSAISGGTLAVQLQWQDPATGTWVPAWTSSTGISAAGSYMFLIGEHAIGNNASISPGAVMPCRLPAAVRLSLVPTTATYDASVGLEVC